MFDELLPIIENGMLSENGSIPIVFEGVEHTIESASWDQKHSKHATHELLYLSNGKLEFEINGNTFTLEKGSTIIILPEVIHSVKVVSRQADMTVIYFGFSKDVDSAEKMLENRSKEVVPGHRGPSVNVPPLTSKTSLDSFIEVAGDGSEKVKGYFVLSSNYKKNISGLVERIAEESRASNISKELMMQLLTMELMITLQRALRKEWEATLLVKNGKARELVLIAKEYIDCNFDSGISIKDAADSVFLSQGYFTRAFRDEIGISPMAYLMNKRISKACELLENKEIKVSGIASQVGFSSPQRFNVAFRKKMNMTPMEYRRSHN